MSLATSLHCRFEELGDQEDIINAIRCIQLAIHIAPRNYETRSDLLSVLGSLYRAQFERFGDILHLNKAIDCHSRAVLLTPEGHKDRPGKLGGLAAPYILRFDCFGKPSDLDKAVECLEQALPLTPHGHPVKPGMLDSLGAAYQFLFKRHDEISYLDRAITCQQQALLLARDDQETEYSILNNLGISYYYRFEQMGELEDINRGIEYCSRAALPIPDTHATKPALLSNLGRSCISRFELLDEIEDLDKGITYHSRAIQLTPNGHANNQGFLKNLAKAYQHRFQRLGQYSDLENIINCGTQAVLLTPCDHADMPDLLSILGASYVQRFDRFGELADLNKALDYLNRATNTLLNSGGNADANTFNDLGNAYQNRFDRLGDITDIDKAIRYHIKAAELTPEGHPYKPSRLNSLGISYLCRFERRGEPEDIENAIHWQTQAVELTPESHLDKPVRLKGLGDSYAARYDRLRRTEDIEMAVECHYRAVLLTPEGHHSEHIRIECLGIAHLSRFDASQDVSDIEKAIECHKRAQLLIPDGHAERPAFLTNLGCAYMCRFKHLGEPEDLNKAVECHNEAVLLSPDGHADKPLRLDNLGSSYLNRFKHQGDRSDAESASKSFQEAAQYAITNPSWQLRSARKWAESSLLLRRSPQQAYQKAMELVPQLVWIGSTVNGRYILTIQLRDTVMEAAAWAISVTSYKLAIDWLETGRSIVWNQMIQLRTPLDDISTADPMLAQCLKDVGSKLELAAFSTITETEPRQALDLEEQNQHRHDLATEWDRLLRQARQLPGFHNFMSPRHFGELADVAAQGAVVIINVHHSRCDALVLRPHNAGIAHVPLREFTSGQASGAHGQLAALIGRLGTRSRGFRPVIHQPELRRLLAMLWTDVVKPILDLLGYTRKSPIDELPRVTWCTTGALSFLPLHAAGYYDGSQPNAPDLVVSSYTPTLSALTSTQAVRSTSTSNPAFGPLAVGQEHNKGLDSLPGTVAELAAIKEQAHATRYSQLDGHKATVDMVLSAMDKHSWVHLACHATQNSHNPAHSAFHLHDGDLTLEAISKRAFNNKGLAFLSACQTAAGSDVFPDEAVHLAAGMLMAGYPSVIATMWSIYDLDGPEIAKHVYAELLTGGKMDHTGAARALHKAVAGLRGKVGTDSFKRWVPFIHFGVQESGFIVNTLLY